MNKKRGEGETNRQMHHLSDAGRRVRYLADRAMPGIIRQPIRMGMEDLGCSDEAYKQQASQYSPPPD